MTVRMKESTLKLLDKALVSFDWEMILKMYKIMKRKIGNDQIKIPGLVKLQKGEKLTPERIKEEVRLIIIHVISQDLPEFVQGPWTIYWVNGEWAIEFEADDDFTNEIESDEMSNEEQEEFDEMEDSLIIPIGESKISIYFVPQAASASEKIEEEIRIVPKIEAPIKITRPTTDLQKELDLAVKLENYELAVRLRDLINEQK